MVEILKNHTRVSVGLLSVSAEALGFDPNETKAYGEIISHDTDVFGELYYEVRLNGHDDTIFANWKIVQKVEEDNKHDKHYLEAVVEPIKGKRKIN